MSWAFLAEASNWTAYTTFCLSVQPDERFIGQWCSLKVVVALIPGCCDERQWHFGWENWLVEGA